MGYLFKLLYNEFLKTVRDPQRILNLVKKRRLHDYVWALRSSLKYMASWSDIGPKQIVSEGYDRIAEQYTEWARGVHKEKRAKYTAVLLEELPAGADVLELGCGSGTPTTRELAKHFVVTGVDISARHVALARKNVPAAKFIHADMMNLDFPPYSFDAVAAFYTIIHVPRLEQPKLLKDISSWLRTGGLFVATMGASSAEVVFREDWLGVPMYWSTFDSETNRRLVEEAGLHIISAQEETEEVFGRLVTFLWVTAQKPIQPPEESEG